MDDWWDGGMDGGAVYSRDSSRGDRLRETRRKSKKKKKKKRGHSLSSLFFFLSKASVTAAEACSLLLPFS